MSEDDEIQIDYELELIKRSKYTPELMNHGKHYGFFTSEVKAMNDSKKNLLLMYDSIIYSRFYAPPFNNLLTLKSVREIFNATGRTSRMSKMELGKPIAERLYAKTAFRIIIAKAIIVNSFPFILRWKRSSDLTTVDQVIEKFCISNRSCMKQLLNGEISGDFLMAHALLCERYSGVHAGVVYAILLTSIKYDIPEIQLIKKILRASL
jgi:hypothetical protein